MFRVLAGDNRETLKTLPDASVNCCVTSPPYWGLRDYGHADQLGLEKTPEEYVANMVGVFREVRRVLRDDGTLWLNLGDSYSGSNCGMSDSRIITVLGAKIADVYVGQRPGTPAGLKPKDLVGIPWRVAFALQADGWYLRSDIIWAKPNPMPESVTDRPTKAHEYLFLLTKSPRYFYDADAVKESASYPNGMNGKSPIKSPHGQGFQAGRSNGSTSTGRNRRSVWKVAEDELEQFRQWKAAQEQHKPDVWTVATAPYSEAHFATFPPKLIEPCIRAGTSENGCCPTCGAGCERVVEATPMVLDRSTRTHEKGRTRSSGTMVEPPKSKTTGWRPSCDCNAGEPIPCSVLDPFGGSGTTAGVANALGRRAILCELSDDYAALIPGRVRSIVDAFYGRTSAPVVKPAAGQRELFALESQ